MPLPRITRTLLPAIALLLLVGLAGCGEDGSMDPPPMAFDTASIQIERQAGDALPIEVEVAESQAQRTRGLGQRDHLEPDAGMIFIFQELQPETAGFWMFRTRFALDIAFLDPAGRIVSILGMEPCESTNPEFCPIYSPGLPYAAALEMNRGWFADNDVVEGDRVDVGDLELTQATGEATGEAAPDETSDLDPAAPDTPDGA